MVLLTVIGFDG